MRGTPAIGQELLESFRNGDIDAYAEIYRVFYPALFNYGKKFTPDDALVEDCIQEIFTTFWIKKSSLKKVVEIKSYLFVSFRNNLIKNIGLQKQLNPISGAETDIVFGLEISADQIMINSEKIYEQRVSLKNAIDKLTERQKEAIFFRFYENMSYEEIATILNITTKATYKLMARAIDELRTTYRLQVDQVLLSLTAIIILSNLSS